jgi:catechol 2,3-dioxygenase
MENEIDPRVALGVVALSVADLDRSLNYYQQGLGLTLLERKGKRATLGAGSRRLLEIAELPGARPVRRVTGLYHFALLLPSRVELARTLKHLADSGTRIDGASDHLVSEALYLSDPDGHGIEIYHDRPDNTWYDQNGRLVGDTLPLDIGSLLAELGPGHDNWSGLHAEAKMGHIHLHVADLDDAEQFYGRVLGFGSPPTSVQIATARFLAAGGYHHHLGLNTWAGAGAPPPPDDASRMLSFEILFPDRDSLDQTVGRIQAAGIEVTEQGGAWLVADPSYNAIVLRVAVSSG